MKQNKRESIISLIRPSSKKSHKTQQDIVNEYLYRVQKILNAHLEIKKLAYRSSEKNLGSLSGDIMKVSKAASGRIPFGLVTESILFKGENSEESFIEVLLCGRKKTTENIYLDTNQSIRIFFLILFKNSEIF